MGWFKRLMARRGNIPSTANWACVQYTGFKKMYPDLSDRQLVKKIIDLRYSVLPIETEKEERLRREIPLIRDLTGLGFAVLAIENDDGTATSPFRDREWVAEATKTMHKVVGKHGLQNIKFECAD